MNIIVRSSSEQPLAEFLEDQDYLVEELNQGILSIRAIGGPTIYVAQEKQTLYFELSLGELGSLKDKASVLYMLLDLNSEIAPVSVAINSSVDKAELCLVERLESTSLDNNEVLSVLEGIGLACLRVQQLLD